MIAKNAETATSGKCTYLRFPSNEEAKQFFDELHVLNKSLDNRTITFNFNTVKKAKTFHHALIGEFGDMSDPKILDFLESEGS
jgi:hypothetical protein